MFTRQLEKMNTTFPLRAILLLPRMGTYVDGYVAQMVRARHS